MSKDNRKITSQLKKLKEVFGDIIKHSELIELESIRIEVGKGLNIVGDMEKDNESGRNSDG